MKQYAISLLTREMERNVKAYNLSCRPCGGRVPKAVWQYLTKLHIGKVGLVSTVFGPPLGHVRMGPGPGTPPCQEMKSPRSVRQACHLVWECPLLCHILCCFPYFRRRGEELGPFCHGTGGVHTGQARYASCVHATGSRPCRLFSLGTETSFRPVLHCLMFSW